MSIHNVSDTTFDHVCTGKKHPDAPPCGAQQTVAHTDRETVKKQVIEGRIYVTIRCSADPGHWECLNADLSAAEETNPLRSDASREQVRNVRALLSQQGIPVLP